MTHDEQYEINKITCLVRGKNWPKEFYTLYTSGIQYQNKGRKKALRCLWIEKDVAAQYRTKEGNTGLHSTQKVVKGCIVPNVSSNGLHSTQYIW